MNKNDKFHGAEFNVSAQAISDEELDAVAGGCEENDAVEVWCPYCNAKMTQKSLAAHKESCARSKYSYTNQHS